ncbi:DUF2065 domain-containing protein [Teichococcus aestuarii]|nr:DUF2065 domain-containing protein [Pseudoroseomonas aestuarii]
MTAFQVLAGMAVVLALEGLLYAAFPGAMRRALATLALQPSERLRLVGLGVAVVAVVAATLLVRA